MLRALHDVPLVGIEPATWHSAIALPDRSTRTATPYFSAGVIDGQPHLGNVVESEECDLAFSWPALRLAEL